MEFGRLIDVLLEIIRKTLIYIWQSSDLSDIIGLLSSFLSALIECYYMGSYLFN